MPAGQPKRTDRMIEFPMPQDTLWVQPQDAIITDSSDVAKISHMCASTFHSPVAGEIVQVLEKLFISVYSIITFFQGIIVCCRFLRFWIYYSKEKWDPFIVKTKKPSIAFSRFSSYTTHLPDKKKGVLRLFILL